MLKIAKKGNGSNFLLTILYWYMPYSIQRLIFTNTPSSDYKFWIY
jgi:type IV conjugative transfer system protein TraL